MPKGIITRGVGGFYYVAVDESIYECKARGIFRKKELTPLPGDRVEISITDEEKKLGAIEKILSRSSVLVRPAIANTNQLIAVVATNTPVPDLELLDKMIINAERQGIESVICVNKIDLGSKVLNDIIRIYSPAGYRIIGTSCITGSGMDELRELLKEKISVFSGQSGVGKSTLLNSIIGSEIMETGEVSEKINRGKQTTRHSQLIKLPNGGYVADTPGFSIYEADLTEYEELYKYYPEFDDYLGKCRFAPCFHINEPECAVKAAVEERKISEERYSMYAQLFRTIKETRRY